MTTATLASQMKVKTHRFAPDAPNEGVWRGKTFVHILTDLVRRRRGTSLVDLGCGPCLFARKAKDCGYRVTAVDARTDRVPPRKELKPIKFVQRDVREFDVRGFEVVCIIGLLHHLELPAQLDLLRRCAAATVIVDTQFYEETRAPMERPDWQKTLVHEGPYAGVRYPEGDTVMAGWGNKHSFWHTEKSLLSMFDACGFVRATKIVPQYSSKHGPRGFFLLAP